MYMYIYCTAIYVAIVHSFNYYMYFILLVTGSSLTKCTFNGLQCCSQFTITLFESGLNLGINNYAPNFLSGFNTAQEVINELRNINKGMIETLSVCSNKLCNHLSIYSSFKCMYTLWLYIHGSGCNNHYCG